MFTDCPVTMIDSNAKGSVSGNESRIVIGCSHDSNCAARIRYMNTSDSRNAVTKAVAIRPSSRLRPANRVVYPGPIPKRAADASIAAITGVCDVPGNKLA
jgi:hypothetical protein